MYRFSVSCVIFQETENIDLSFKKCRFFILQINKFRSAINADSYNEFNESPFWSREKTSKPNGWKRVIWLSRSGSCMNVCGTLVEVHYHGKPTVGPLGKQPVSVKVKWCRAASLSPIEILKTFFRHFDVQRFTWFTLQPKPATEIGCWQLQWGFENKVRKIKIN